MNKQNKFKKQAIQQSFMRFVSTTTTTEEKKHLKNSWAQWNTKQNKNASTENEMHRKQNKNVQVIHFDIANL